MPRHTTATAVEIKIAYIGGGSRNWAQMVMTDLALCPHLKGEIVLYDIHHAAALANVKRAGEISLSETDARDPARVMYWLGKLEILSDGLRVTGRRSVRNRQSNEELSGTDVDERWKLGADGMLAKM